MLDLQLHAGRKEGRTLEQTGDHRIALPFDEAAEALGDARVLFRKLARMLPQKAEFPIVEVEELAVHSVFSSPFSRARLIAAQP